MRARAPEELLDRVAHMSASLEPEPPPNGALGDLDIGVVYPTILTVYGVCGGLVAGPVLRQLGLPIVVRHNPHTTGASFWWSWAERLMVGGSTLRKGWDGSARGRGQATPDKGYENLGSSAEALHEPRCRWRWTSQIRDTGPRNSDDDLEEGRTFMKRSIQGQPLDNPKREDPRCRAAQWQQLAAKRPYL